MSRRLVAANITTTFIGCVRRMPGFDSFWLSYRTPSAETPITQGDTASIYVVRCLGQTSWSRLCGASASRIENARERACGASKTRLSALIENVP
jgi:hypothetical protein